MRTLTGSRLVRIAGACIAASAGAALIVLLAGDEQANGGPEATEAATKRWLTLESSPLSRTEVGAARIGRFIYVVGGFSAPAGDTTDQAVRYDIEAGDWQPLDPMPIGVNHPAVTSHRGKLYVHGGYAEAGSLSGEIDALQRYDPATGSWVTLTPSGPARAAHTLAAVRGRLWAIGGAHNNGQPLATVEVYDIAADRWTRGPRIRVPRDHLASAVIGTRILVLGGRARGFNLRVVERLDTLRREWAKLRPLRKARSGFQAVTVRKRVVAVGGEELAEGDNTIRRVELYEPRLKRWRKLPGMLTPRHGLGLAARKRRVFALEGGPQPGGSFSSVLEFLDVPKRLPGKS